MHCFGIISDIDTIDSGPYLSSLCSYEIASLGQMSNPHPYMRYDFLYGFVRVMLFRWRNIMSVNMMVAIHIHTYMYICMYIRVYVHTSRGSHDSTSIPEFFCLECCRSSV